MNLFYYRYRPVSELTLKELRYNELYFSSRAENNDPYDGKVFLSYDFDIEKWERFVYAAITKSGFDEEFLKKLSKKLAGKLYSDKILTYQDIANYNFMQSILFIEPSLGRIFAYNLTEIIKQLFCKLNFGFIFCIVNF